MKDKVKESEARALAKKDDWDDDDIALAKVMIRGLIADRRRIKADLKWAEISHAGTRSVLASANSLIGVRNEQITDLNRNSMRMR